MFRKEKMLLAGAVLLGAADLVLAADAWRKGKKTTLYDLALASAELMKEKLAEAENSPGPEGPETEAAPRAGLTDRETAAKDTGDGTERYAEPVPSAAQ